MSSRLTMRQRPAPRARRIAHFPLARAGARQDEIRRVAAHREQQQQHHGLQDRERRAQQPLRPARRLPEREQLRLHRRVGVGIHLRELPHRRVEFGLRLRARRAAARACRSPCSREGRGPRARAIRRARPARASPAPRHRTSAPSPCPGIPAGATPTIVRSSRSPGASARRRRRRRSATASSRTR